MKKTILLLWWLLWVGAGMSQTPQKVGVYVTGEVNAGNKKIAGQKIVSGISSNTDFVATERTVAFLSELAKDHDYKVNAPVNETRIIEIGRQFGLDYVVVAELTDAMGELVISSKMMDVQGNGQTVSAENIVKVRQASDLMRAAEDVARQLLDNLNKQKESAVQPEMQENAVVEEPQMSQDSVEILSPKSSTKRIAIQKVVNSDGLLGNGVKMMIQSFITDYVAKLHGYEVLDRELPTGYGSVDRSADCLLKIEVNRLDENNILYTAQLFDIETAMIIGAATLMGHNDEDAYRNDVEKVLDKLLKNR